MKYFLNKLYFIIKWNRKKAIDLIYISLQTGEKARSENKNEYTAHFKVGF
jgi:hypothetical protein